MSFVIEHSANIVHCSPKAQLQTDTTYTQGTTSATNVPVAIVAITETLALTHVGLFGKPAAGQLNYKGMTPITVNAIATVTYVDAAGDDLIWSICKNGVVQCSFTQQAIAATNMIATFQTQINVGVGDVINIYVLNASGSTNLTSMKYSLNLIA